MTVIWSGVTEDGAVVPVQVDGAGRVVATTGEPPGPPVIDYGGASAWGNISFDGTVNGGLNVQTVRRPSKGVYNIIFNTPMGNSNYSVTATSAQITGVYAVTGNYTPEGFTLEIRSDAGTNEDEPFTFQVYSINSLPPVGSTGTDCWGSCLGDGTLETGFNVASVTRTSFGKYSVVFSVPMPTADYAVNTTLTSVNTTFVSSQSHTTSGFEVCVYYGSGGTINYGDAPFVFSVNATNATLPVTVTAEELKAVTNNWYRVDSAKDSSVLTTKYKVEMQDGIVFAGGKAGITRDGELYFTSNGGKYVIAVNEGAIGLTRIDSTY